MKEISVPKPASETRVLNCFIMPGNLVLLIFDEAIMYLDTDLNYLTQLRSAHFDPSFIYFSCISPDLDSKDDKGFLLCGQVESGKWDNTYTGWTEKNDKALLIRTRLNSKKLEKTSIRTDSILLKKEDLYGILEYSHNK